MLTLAATPAFAAHTIGISVSEAGLFPASSSVYLQSVVPGTIQTEIDRQCGQMAAVSDLNVHVHLIHNELPGTASLQIQGTAICR